MCCLVRPCFDNLLPEVTGMWNYAGTEVPIRAQVVVTPKGGTVTRSWDLFLEHMHATIHPELKDEAGYRVAVKSDLGLGRLAIWLIRKWHKKGLLFKFGLPSGSSVNQEQDQIYG